MGTALPLIAIYLYTKVYLNANSSFKVNCLTRYWMGGRTKQQLSGEHKNEHLTTLYVS